MSRMDGLLEDFEVFPWNENFETGHELIDEQHRELVRLLNLLGSSLVKNDPDEVNQVFDALGAYANFHFEAEERIWRKYFSDDNWFDSHQISHASFLPRVIEIRQQNEGKPLPEVIELVIKFLIRWLAFHIIDNDKRMAFVIQAMDQGKSIAEAKTVADEKMSGSMRILIETIMNMYDGLSSRTIDLLRERNARLEAEARLTTMNQKLQAMAITDPLTNLFNRRHFDSVLESELARAHRNHESLSLMLVDLDHFKQLNDRFGHAIGDKALAATGLTLKDACRRPSDFAFRIGGEEFAIICTHKDDEDIDRFAEIIRETIAQTPIDLDGVKGSLQITASLGVVSVHSPQTESATRITLFNEADHNLYAAKHGGRNKVICTISEPEALSAPSELSTGRTQKVERAVN